jgi:hypothetical protein
MRADGSPFNSSGTVGPLKVTVITMTIMLPESQLVVSSDRGPYIYLTRAKVEALESFSMLRYNDSGYENARVKKTMTKRLEMRKENAACPAREGKSEART